MFYQEVATIIDTVRNKKGSPKSLVLSSKSTNKKQLYALVCETLKYGAVLKGIIDATKLHKHERLLTSETVTQVLVYDLLFGKGLHGSGKLQKAVLRHQTSLKAELARAKIKNKVIRNEDLLPDSVKLQAQLPRYVRVNLIKTSVSEVIQHFKNDGFKLVEPECEDPLRFLEFLKHLEPKQFVQDLHLKDLLVFTSGTDLHAHTLYINGQVILQDKASCMPAFILDPPPNSHVIDCCAAPGNKTSHVASLMANKGKIFSFDLDMRRLSTMNQLITKAGVSCAELCNQDFLKVDPMLKKFSRVEYIVVDPSCSGSGIVSRQDTSSDSEEMSKERLENLASFQASILKHALSFPHVKRVVYSTCSIHQEENEEVTLQALEASGGQFHLKHILPEWPHRGNELFDNSQNCLRFSPGEDMTNGFFVACFERNCNGEIVKVKGLGHANKGNDEIMLAKGHANKGNGAFQINKNVDRPEKQEGVSKNTGNDRTEHKKLMRQAASSLKTKLKNKKKRERKKRKYLQSSSS